MQSDEAVLEAGKELDELLKKLGEFPVNTYTAYDPLSEYFIYFSFAFIEPCRGLQIYSEVCV